MAEERPLGLNLAQPFLEAFAGLPLSGRETMSILRELGFKFTDTNFWKDWRRAQDVIKYEVPIGGLMPESFVPKSWITEIPREKQQMANPYRYDFYVTFRDVETGELLDPVKRSLSHGVYASKGAISDYFRSKIPWDEAYPEKELVDVELRGVWHQEGSSW